MKNKEKYIGSLVILILSIVFLIVGYNISRPKEVKTKGENIFVEDNVVKESKFKSDVSPEVIMVDVKGAINKPGVYSLKRESRINDLIQMAGGFGKDADINRIHLSRRLKDEDLVYIYKIGEKEEPKFVSGIENNNKSGTVSDNSSSTGNSSSGKVNLNTASIEELKTLPGVGDVTAKKILEYREKSGAFSSVEDLMKIDRIGEKTLSKLRDKVDI